MKKIAVLLLLLYPVIVSAQKKPPKPNLSKAEKALREKQLSVARQIIDVTVAHEKFASKAKAWYVCGVIYASIDTSQDETIKANMSDPFSTAKQAFEKYKSLKDEKHPVYLTNDIGLPIMPPQIDVSFAQHYFDIGLKHYREEDYKASLENAQKTLFFIPQDTSVLLNVGLFFAPAAEEYKTAITYLKKYIELEGTSLDAYTMLFSIYRDKLEDNENALAITKEAIVKYPDNADFPKYELDIYIKMNKLEEARSIMEKQAETDPQDAETHYYLGLINQELDDNKAALSWYKKALHIKPDYLNACTAIAEIVYLDARKIKKEMNALGISKEDQKKRFALDALLVKKLKDTLPYWTKCEKISPKDPKTLDNLLTIYNDLGIESEADRIRKTMKLIGL